MTTLLWFACGLGFGLLLGYCFTATLAFRRREDYVSHLTDQVGKEREAWAAERRDLNNRIQVPEAAPFMDTSEAPTRQHVPFDDDVAFQAAQEEMTEWP